MANEVVIHVTARDETGAVFGNVEKKAKGFGANLASIGRIAAGNFIANAAGSGIAILGDQIGDAFAQAREAVIVQKQTEAVLASTGGVAGMTADEVEKLANSLSTMTNFDDEAIQSAENLLLTFTSIGEDVFPQATEIVLDMSQALGQDLKSSAIQLGKAMNDPILGATALRRVGVALTDQQMDQIKAFQESGDLLSAQGIIMAELQKEFGGSARATADPMIQLQHSIDNVKESLGKAFLPVLNEAATNLAKFLTEHQAEIDQFAQMLGVKVPEAVRAIARAWQENEPTIRAAAELFMVVAQRVADGMKIILDMVTIGLALIRGDWGAAWQGIKQLGVDIWNAIVNDITMRVNLIRGIITIAGELIKQAWSAVWNGLKDIAGGAFSVIGERLRDIVRGVLVDIKGALDAIPGPNPAGNALQGAINALSPGLGATSGSTSPRAGGMDSFASGTPFVPRDMPAFLHRGERVLTASENKAYSSGGANMAYITINQYGAGNDNENLVRTLVRRLRDELGMETLAGPRLPAGAFSPRRA